jgi:hypothetical protein
MQVPPTVSSRDYRAVALGVTIDSPGALAVSSTGMNIKWLEFNFSAILVSGSATLYDQREFETPHVQGEIGLGWHIDQPISLRVERDDDGSFIVSDDKFAVYGQGATLDEAIADYKTSLAEYAELVESQAACHSPTANLLKKLQMFLSKNRNR